MHHVFWYGKKGRDCHGIWTTCTDTASEVAKAMKRVGWKVVWMVHTSDKVEPFDRGEWRGAFAQWCHDSIQ